MYKPAAQDIHPIAFPTMPARAPAAPHVKQGRAGPSGRLAPGPAGKATPEAVLRAFNTWSFKREQPDNVETLLAAIGAAVARNKPVPFVLYWGKGPRARLAEPEIQCLDYLASMRARIAACYPPGADFTLIQTDSHARLNGHAESRIDAYFDAVAHAAAARGYACRRLSAIVAEHASAIAPDEEPTGEFLAQLAECARKWYRGPDAPETGALRYFRMNMVEKRAVAAAFPDAIFVTFNGGDVRALLPDAMPVFFMYSIRRGVAEKPWFMPGENVLDLLAR